MRHPLIAAVLLALLASSGTGAAAEAQTKKAVDLHGQRVGNDVSSTVASIGDKPNHEFVQRVYLYDISSKSNKDFDGLRCTNFAQTESTDGSGTHRGYGIWKNKAGDSIFVKFEGSHRAQGGAGKEAEYDGTFEFTGGTGKFAHISGKDMYKGRITATTQSWDATVDVSY